MSLTLAWTGEVSEVTAPLLQIENLAVNARKDGVVTPLVDGVDLSIMPGERVGIVGESGSGKSLTCLSVMGLLPSGLRIAEGSVNFQGTDLTRLSDRAYNRVRGKDLTMIYQEPLSSLNPLMRVGRQVGEALDGRSGRGTMVLESLERVGIADPRRVARQFPHELSGGMRQRVMIAMATINRPALLIADEPTTALDVTIQTQVLKVMYDVSVEVGTAVLLVSHDLGAVERLVDRLIVMYAGRVVEDGPLAQVLAHPAHPYTKALLASSPTLGTRTERLPVIGGTVPSPGSWPAGCRFAPRCPIRRAECEQVIPSMEPVGAQHEVACWAAPSHDRRSA